MFAGMVSFIHMLRLFLSFVVLGLFALRGSSMTLPTGVFVLTLGTLALTIMRIRSKAPRPTTAEVRHV